MNIQAIHHVSLSVTDLEQARAFYKDVLGLREVPRPPFNFPGAWLAAGETQHVHLIVHTNSTFRAGKGLDNRDGHFAVRVANYWATVQELRAKGYSEDATDVHRQMRVQPHGTAGFPQIYILDPDRNVIEINAASLD